MMMQWAAARRFAAASRWMVPRGHATVRSFWGSVRVESASAPGTGKEADGRIYRDTRLDDFLKKVFDGAVPWYVDITMRDFWKFKYEDDYPAEELEARSAHLEPRRVTLEEKLQFQKEEEEAEAEAEAEDDADDEFLEKWKEWIMRGGKRKDTEWSEYVAATLEKYKCPEHERRLLEEADKVEQRLAEEASRVEPEVKRHELGFDYRPRTLNKWYDPDAHTLYPSGKVRWAGQGPSEAGLEEEFSVRQLLEPRFKLESHAWLAHDATVRNPIPPISPSMDDEECVLRYLGRCSTLAINNTIERNALTSKVVKRLTQLVEKHARSETKAMLMLRSAGTCGFSIGTNFDELKLMSGTQREEFAHDLLLLSHRIASLDVPVASVMAGHTVGSAGGIALSATMPCATETTKLAFPQTGFGYFPDAGACFALNHSHGHIGKWMALTGSMLKGYDVKLSGLATHCLSEGALNFLCDAIEEGGGMDIEQLLIKMEYIEGPASLFSLRQHMPVMDYCFEPNSIEMIIQRLEEYDTPWARQQLQLLSSKCPLSLKVTVKLFDLATKLPFNDFLAIEHRVARKMMAQEDFMKGYTEQYREVDAAVRWSHASVEEVDDYEVGKLFLYDGEDKEFEEVPILELARERRLTPKELGSVWELDEFVSPIKHEVFSSAILPEWRWQPEPTAGGRWGPDDFTDPWWEDMLEPEEADLADDQDRENATTYEILDIDEEREMIEEENDIAERLAMGMEEDEQIFMESDIRAEDRIM